MKMPQKPSDNAILRFGMERRIKRVSTLVMLLITIGVISLILLTALGNISFIFGSSSSGTGWYIALSVMEFLAIALISSSNSAGEIAGEKSRQTLDLLICSQMSPKAIIRGKLLSNFMYSLLIVAAMLPFYAVIYLFGGFSPISVIEFILYMLNWIFSICCVGIMFSALVKRSAPASILSIAFWAVLTLGNGFLALVWEFFTEVLRQNVSYTPSNFEYPPILWFNPATGFVILFIGQIDGWSSLSRNLNFFESYFPLIMGIVMPVLISFIAITIAERAIDPMRSGKTKGGI